VVVGFTLDKLEVRLSNLMAFDATVQGSWGCLPEHYPDALRLVTSGRVTLAPFIERHPLSRGAEVLRQVADHALHRRAILVPGDSD
jgi:6-hydroxycyclohex-1-ene-1-carbonyl-CoA dehydrogenase